MSSTSWCSWSDFSAASPRLAAAVRDLLELYGQGFGYLATVRDDGGPRVHPVSPVIADGGLYCFVTRSPKRGDLERDGRYALHASPPEDSDDEAYVAGRVREIHDELRCRRLARLHPSANPVDWKLFEFEIDVAMLTRRDGRYKPAEHRIWHAPAA